MAVTPSTAQSADTARLQEDLDALEALTPSSFAERYPTSFQVAPAYDLTKVAGLDLIQASIPLKLDGEGQAALQKYGFAIVDNRWFPTHSYGYSTIYLEDLPVYISADSILDAVHRSYDSILKTLEGQLLLAELDQLLAGMHQNLAQGGSGASDSAVADADIYLAVARSLLKGTNVAPLSPSNVEVVSELVTKARAASGTASLSLFGVERKDEDFSQFKPRGHYSDDAELSNYFRAMIWLGRIDFRLLETQPDGTQLFRRRQVEGAALLRALIDEKLEPHYARLASITSAFVGEPDYMSPEDMDSLLKAVDATGPSDLQKVSDQVLAQAIVDGNYGLQRISSHIMVSGPHSGALPLSRSFALLGQRYTLDSHVFSNVVYDRVNGGAHARMMPSPLDAAFAALGNDQAGALLQPELSSYADSGYPTALAQMRLLADDHGDDYWTGSLYATWLGALRELSPAVTSSADDATSIFPVARSEAWGRRLLSTQLASWAELRHDTVLYTKQSYSGGATCDFPDAYVDPYPSFFAALSAYAARGKQLLETLQLPSGELTTTIADYFDSLGGVTEQLRAIAENERKGAELTPEMLAFVNDAVKIGFSCAGDAAVETGWYLKLFFQQADSANMNPTIADVHTQPTDEAGSPVGRVLHVGTGAPREMVVIAEGCSGPRAYVGMASSYRERITENFERLDDNTWEGEWRNSPELPWLSDVVTKHQ